MNPEIIYLKDWLTLIALLLSPLLAVGWTLWYQKNSERRAAKVRLFIVLMGHRKSIPINPEWVQALNVIDVVYADHPKVVARWHTLYDVLCTAPLNEARLQHSQLELLSEMAGCLGYRTLQQTDIDKFYVPDQMAQQATRTYEAQVELVRLLKATETLGAPRKKDDAHGGSD